MTSSTKVSFEASLLGYADFVSDLEMSLARVNDMVDAGVHFDALKSVDTTPGSVSLNLFDDSFFAFVSPPAFDSPRQLACFLRQTHVVRCLFASNNLDLPR